MMENQATEQIVVSHSSDAISLEDFKQSVLGVESELSSSFSMLSPDSFVMQPSEYMDDQFEGVFYNTFRDESRISVSFVSVFYNLFQTKFLADFANSIQKDDSNCLELERSSKTVIITGVGRIVWRKECFPRITRAIFKQYVFLSEKGK